MARRAKKREGALYHGLPPGTHGIDTAEVRRHQRARIHGAMIAAVARDGYANTTIAAVVRLAGVSRTTFYEHFSSKEDCFLKTHDMIVGLAVERVAEAHRSADGLREQLRDAFSAFLTIVAAEPEAARLVIIEALAAGDVALEHRERAVLSFQQLLKESLSRAPGAISDVTLRALVGGVQRIVYIHLREQRVDDLPGLVDELVDWALSYQDPDVAPPRPLRIRRKSAPSTPDFEIAMPDPERARAIMTPRQRILQAAASLVAKSGYESLTVPAISTRAGISNQTFYQHFKTKQDAFLALFDEAAADALGVISTAARSRPTLPASIREVVRATLAYTAKHPAFARLVFFEPLAPGTAGQERAERILQSCVDLVTTAELRPPGVPSIAEQAIAGGCLSVIQGEIAYGGLKRLPRLTACLAYIALAPFTGAAAATRIAQG